MARLNWDVSDDETANYDDTKAADKFISSTQHLSNKRKSDENVRKADSKDTQKSKKIKKESKQKDEEEKKTKFTISSTLSNEAIPKDSDDVGDEMVPAGEDNPDIETKKSRKTVSENKRKSLKHKQKKKKEKLDALRSTMTKEEFQQLNSPTQPDQTAKEAALSYLRLWNSCRSAWKFSKVRQIWLLQNMFNTSSVNDDDFQILLKYIEPLKGSANEKTKQDANSRIEHHMNQSDQSSRTIVSRATSVLQILD